VTKYKHGLDIPIYSRAECFGSINSTGPLQHSQSPAKPKPERCRKSIQFLEHNQLD
jgi:hypothetical protein